MWSTFQFTSSYCRVIAWFWRMLSVFELCWPHCFRSHESYHEDEEPLHYRNETLSIGACKPTFNSSCRYLPEWYISKICFVKQILNFYTIKFSWLHNYNKLEINLPHTPHYAMLGTKYLLFSQMMWCFRNNLVRFKI